MILTLLTYPISSGATAVEDWTNSLKRQIEFYEYLQTSAGAFAGGVTNSWKGRYAQPDSDLLNNTFYGMFYDWEPVSNFLFLFYVISNYLMFLFRCIMTHHQINGTVCSPGRLIVWLNITTSPETVRLAPS